MRPRPVQRSLAAAWYCDMTSAAIRPAGRAPRGPVGLPRLGFDHVSARSGCGRQELALVPAVVSRPSSPAARTAVIKRASR